MKNGLPMAIKDGDGSLSESAAWLIGGLVQLGEALMAFGNRVEDSFARLVQGKEAPNTIVWGEFDRNALVRLPVVATGYDPRPRHKGPGRSATAQYFGRRGRGIGGCCKSAAELR
jgi:glutamine synthetase